MNSIEEKVLQLHSCEKSESVQDNYFMEGTTLGVSDESLKFSCSGKCLKSSFTRVSRLAEKDVLVYLDGGEQLRNSLRTQSGILYNSIRDLIPPYPFGDHKQNLHTDILVYNTGSLSQNEGFRSLGHWNPIDQFEFFVCLRGSVKMLLASPCSKILTSRTISEAQACFLKGGEWHTTYPLDSNSVVINFYNRRVAEVECEKYSSAPPLEATILNSGEIVISDKLNATIVESPPSKSLSEIIPGSNPVDLLSIIMGENEMNIDQLVSLSLTISSTEILQQ